MSERLSEADKQLLQQLEEELWHAETRFDRVYMDKIFAADFWEIGRSGRVYDREQLLAVSGQMIEAVIPLPDFEIRPLTANVVQVTYNSHVTYDGVVQKGRRSSIWSRTAEGGWELRFHQGTPYDK